MKFFDWTIRKKEKQKISMVTCYDYSSAKVIAQSDIDAILVGDSLAMTIYGHSSTLPATIEMMELHTAAVTRGAPQKFIISDLPFLSYRKDLKTSMDAVGKLMVAGAQAVKLEGSHGNLDLIRHLVESGIPVMGHLGLTPQSVNTLGGYVVQGRSEADKDAISKQALELEKAGCFSLVLECVPNELAKNITEMLRIPTIGIGAGGSTDGQVLVFQDLLGLNLDFKPRFVRSYLNGADLITAALNQYHKDSKEGSFPNEKESYS